MAIRIRQQLQRKAFAHRRAVFSWRNPPTQSSKPNPDATTGDGIRLQQDNLFHPLSSSPFPDLVRRGKRIQAYAPCPVCLKSHDTRRPVRHECESCGYPTHCTEEHWIEDMEHKKYCTRLHESNEDEHDLRSGRRITEFEMPGPISYEQTVSLANWDVFWYSAGFASIDTERQRRHASKLLSYPMSVAGTLHQHSPLTLRNHRLTAEGSRSLAALRTTIHVPPGAPDIRAAGVNRPPMRIFIIGARSEASLPPHIWEQVCMLFPAAVFQIFFIGPEVSFPRPKSVKNDSPLTDVPASMTKTTDTKAISSSWNPPLQPGFSTEKKIISMNASYGIESYYLPYSPRLSITGIKGAFSDVFSHFQGTFDPYTDVFFLFHPGFGFPSSSCKDGLQISSPTEWGPVLPQLLESKCAIFVTAFSPTDMERDVRSLDGAAGVGGEFDWVVTPGQNPFGSEKWDIAEFDPRVMVKTNWGIWGIRGKRRDIRETWI